MKIVLQGVRVSGDLVDFNEATWEAWRRTPTQDSGITQLAVTIDGRQTFLMPTSLGGSTYQRALELVNLAFGRLHGTSVGHSHA